MPNAPLKTFIIYARDDKAHKDDLLRHLKTLERSHLLEIWHDGQINLGEEWQKELKDNLKKSDLVLVLVTVNSINSDFINTVELETAWQRLQAGVTRIIPIIVSPCLWWEEPIFKDLQGLPKDMKPITTWHNKDEAWTDVAIKIAEMGKQIWEQVNEKERLLLEKQEKERLAKIAEEERLQNEKIAAEEKVERERLAKIEVERQEKEKLAKIAAEENAERERLAKIEAEKQEKERLAKMAEVEKEEAKLLFPFSQKNALFSQQQNTKTQMPRKKQGSIDLFVAYAHQDAELQSRLHTHLVSLQRAHLIQEIWYDKLIQAGGEWEKTIDKKLHAADIILLLISVDFLASDYCFGKEMQDALRLHEQGKTKVLPIILGACTWKHSPIAHIEVLPHKGKHVKSYADIDEALHEIIEKIAEVAQEIKERQDTELGRYRIAEEKRKQEEAKLLAKIEKERLENERLARLEPEIEQKKIQLDEMPIHKQYMYVQRVFTGNNVRFRIIVGKANAAHSKQEIEEIIDKYILSNPDIRPKDSVVEEFIGILRGRFI